MFNLDFLKGPLLTAASSFNTSPQPIPANPGLKPTAPKPIPGGWFGKAKQALSAGAALPDVDEDNPQLAMPSFDPLANRMPAVHMPEDPKVEDVPIPALPGRTGGPRPYDPQIKHEYDYVMSKVPRDEAGNERKPTFGERFKSSLLPALLGAVQGINSPAGQRNPLGGAIGGAGAGFAGGIMDPISARQYEWSQMYKPELDQQEAHRGQEAEDKRKADEALVNLEARRAGIDLTKAQTDMARTNAEANRAYKESQAELNGAKAKAALTGKPEYTNLVVNGVPGTYEVFPGKEPRLLGESEKAYLQQQGILSKEKIAGERNATSKEIATGRNQTAIQTTEMREGGATHRTVMTQAGQNQRAAGKPGGGSPVPKGKSSGGIRQSFIDRAVSAGYSRSEAEAEANRRGLK